MIFNRKRRGIESQVTEAQAVARLAAVVEGSDDAIVATLLDGTVTSWNHAAEHLYGYTSQEMVGENISFIYPKDQQNQLAEIMASVRAGKRTVPIVGRRLRKDQSLVEVEVRVSPIFDGEKAIAGISAIAREIGERIRIEREARETLEFLLRTQELSGVGSWRSELDPDAPGYWSPMNYRILGIDPDRQVTDRDFYDAVHPDDRERVLEIDASVLSSGRHAELEYRIIRPDGAVRWIFGATDVRRDDEGNPLGLSGVCRDITDAKAAEAHLAHDALHDPLTGLPNRALLLDRLEQALTHTDQEHPLVAVLFADLDRFKLINDTRGHELGDTVLQAVARRLRESFPVADTVGRLGGDELVIICEGIRDGIEASERAAQLISVFQSPFLIGHGETHVTASVGVAVGGPENTAEVLIRDADLAMYRAKERGRNRFELFDLELRERSEQHSTLGAALWRALDHEELFLEFQPIISLTENRFVGAEALLRWRHPELGMVMPEDFIPIAEESGLIVPIGTWVLESACRQMRAWIASPEFGRQSVSVNVAASQLRAPDFPGVVKRALEGAGLEGAALRIELTEATLVGGDDVLDVLEQLRNLGVHIAIDDFGTKYSSLSYLTRLPIDELKIDQTFVNGLIDNKSKRAIVSAILAIGQSLNFGVTVEGIETKAQLDELRSLGCETVQGNYFAEPMAPDKYLALLQRSPT